MTSKNAINEVNEILLEQFCGKIYSFGRLAVLIVKLNVPGGVNLD